MADPAEIEMLRQMLLQEGAILPPQRVPRPGDPGLPPNGMTVARSQLSPSADALMGATGLPVGAGPALSVVTDAGQAFGQQPDVMGRALAEAEYDPTIPKVTNAALQTALAAGRPGIAAGAFGVRAADAIRQDLGIGNTEAEAAQRLNREQRQQMEMEAQRAEQQRKSEAARIDATAKANTAQEDARRQGELKAEAERKDRDIYDRAVTRAEERRAAELGRQKRFSETELGKVFDEYGAAAPYLFGGLAGGALRLAKPAYDPLKAALLGGVAGAGAGNWPLISDSYITPPVLNPEKEGAKAYVMEAPENDPVRARMQEYLNTNPPDANPIRTQAQSEFLGPYGLGLAGRALATGAEGALGSEIAYNTLHGASKTKDITNWLRQQFGGGSPTPPGPVAPAPQAAQRQGHWQNQPRGQPGNKGQWKKGP